MNRLAIVAVASLAMAGCGSESSGTFEDGEGGEGSYRVEQAGDEVTATVETEDGTTTIRSGADVPVELPDGFSIYPGATVAVNTSFGAASGNGALVNMTSGDSPRKMVDFYRKQAKAAGLEISLDTTMGDQIAIAGEGKDGRRFTFNASPGAEGTEAQLMIAEGL